MEFTPNKAWIFVYLLFVVRILPDIPCKNKEVFSMDSRLSLYPLFTEYLPTAHKKIKIMDSLIDYCASKVVPRVAYSECITNYNKKGDLK